MRARRSQRSFPEAVALAEPAESDAASFRLTDSGAFAASAFSAPDGSLIVTVDALPADSETFTEESLNVFLPCLGFFFDAASVTVPLTVPFTARLQVAVAVKVPALLTGLACFFFFEGGSATFVDFSFSVHLSFGGGGGAFLSNVAVTVVAALTVTEHVPVPEQPPPDQAANVEPEAGAAVRLTVWPAVNDFEHVPGHEIPPPLTVPEPVPAVATMSA